MSPRGLPRVGRDPQAGQALVLVAISLVVLLGMAAVAIDAGRFLTQRRFVQNAADAAALAAANVVVSQSGAATVGTARQAARDVLAIDLAGSAVGAPVFAAAEPPVFSGAQIASDLVDGIVLADAAGTPLPDTASLDSVADVRVALSGPVDFTFGRVLGVTTGTVSAKARVGFNGDLLPIAVRRYINLSGPYASGSCSDPPIGGKFADLAATQATDCQGAADSIPLGYGGRTPASLGQPGATTVLIGQGAQSSNDQAFRGFINLDIRNFDDLNSRVYYNNVPVGANSNTMKAFEARWIPGGYPGPGFPPVTTPPDPNDQVGIMDGNSAGLLVPDLQARWSVGDKILCALYDGTVMSIPDFSITGPSSITLAANIPSPNAGTISVKPNKQFGATVIVGTANRPPWLMTSYTPSGAFTPSQPNGSTVTLAATANTTTPQVDTLWVKGHSASPYLTDHYAPIAVAVSGVTKDFTVNVSPDQAPANWGDPVTFTATVTVGSASDFPAGVHLSLEPAGSIDSLSPKPFPNVAAGSYSFNGAPDTTITSWSGNGNSRTGTATFTINTTQLGAQATYDFVLTAQGTNSASQSIRRQVSGHVLSQGVSDNSSYIDITGFAVYQITSISANSMTGQAVSQIAPTPDDPRLRAALTPRLRPW